MKINNAVMGGVDTCDATATENKVLYGYTAYANRTKITGNVQSTGSKTYRPNQNTQIIKSGKYLSGDQTIEGDSNLISANIKENIKIFGVVGKLIQGVPIDLPYTKITSGKITLAADGRPDVIEYNLGVPILYFFLYSKDKGMGPGYTAMFVARNNQQWYDPGSTAWTGTTAACVVSGGGVHECKGDLMNNNMIRLYGITPADIFNMQAGKEYFWMAVA